MINFLYTYEWNYSLLSLVIALLVLLGTIRHRGWSKQEKNRETDHKCGELLHEAYLLCGADNPSNSIISFADKKDLYKAHNLIEQALTLNPESSRAYDLKGSYYQGMKQHRDAEKCFKKSIKLDRKNSASYYNLARLLWTKGNKKEAIKNLNKAIKINNSDGDYQVVLGYWHEQMGDLTTAEKLYTSARTFDPVNYWVHGYLGLLYLKQNRVMEAKRTYYRAKQLNNGDPKQLAILANNLGYYNDAELIIKKHLKDVNKDLFMDFVLAHVLLALDKTDEATLYFSNCIKTNPGYFLKYLYLFNEPQADEVIRIGLAKAKLLLEKLMHLDLSHDDRANEIEKISFQIIDNLYGNTRSAVIAKRVLNNISTPLQAPA